MSLLRLALGIGCILVSLACGPAGVRRDLAPGTGGAGAGGRASAGVEGLGTGGEAADPTLGVPCTADEQCDDEVTCTADACDGLVGRCRHAPDDGRCGDGAYCNGTERCELRRGCSPGEPVACSDGSACTIDRCDEATESCEHRPRDVDGDGDPDGNCVEGADCDDLDPLVSSLGVEVCATGRDEDCDGAVDEADCVVPAHDTCADPLEITASGTYEITLAGANHDYAATCFGAAARDVVVALVLAEPGSADLSLTGPGAFSIAAATLCGDPANELACAAGVPSLAGGDLSRLRLPSLPSGATAVAISATSGEPRRLRVELGPPATAPENETCGTAADLAPGVATEVSLVGVAADVASACPGWSADLVYAVEVAVTSDLSVYAASTDGVAEPMVAILREPCSSLEDELTCARGAPATAAEPALPPGRYYIAVSASAPTDLALVAELSTPSDPTDGEACDDPLSLEVGRRQTVDLLAFADDLTTTCGDGVDAVGQVALDEEGDALALLRLSAGDVGAVAWRHGGCDGEERSCVQGQDSPLRALTRGLPAGEHSIVVESQMGAPTELSVLTHPAGPPVLVAAADDCASAVVVPAEGGVFFGNTSAASDDYGASCDRGDAEGSRDQMLSLTLEARRRLVLDAGESGYLTLVDLRRGPDCPGAEVPLGCSAGFVAGRSFVDAVVDPGQYWIQVDGYDGEVGAWVLDVFVGPP